MQGRSARRPVARRAAAVVLALGALGAGSTTAMADNSTVVGQWRFDEGAGQTAFDDGPFALDGRLGTVDAADGHDPERIAGLQGGALRFDGRSFVRLPNTTLLEPPTLTVEAVVRASETPGAYRYVVSHGAQGCLAGSYGLYTGEHGGIAFYAFDGGEYRVSAEADPSAVWDGKWHHVAGVYDGGFVRVYVDGHPVGQPFDAPSRISYGLSSSDAYIGTYLGSCVLPLRGDLDLVRMWRGPLAPDFIGSLADAALGVTGPPAPPPVTPAPDTVPTATDADSNAGAPASRTTLPAVTGGQAIRAPATATSGAAAKPTPGAPARACVVRSSTKKVRAGRRTSLTVHVALRGKPLKAVRVVATEAKSRLRLATGRTAKDGRARLKVRPRRRGTIQLKVQGRADCGSTALTVLQARAK
jgi:hypothetical protein